MLLEVLAYHGKVQVQYVPMILLINSVHSGNSQTVRRFPTGNHHCPICHYTPKSSSLNCNAQHAFVSGVLPPPVFCFTQMELFVTTHRRDNPFMTKLRSESVDLRFFPHCNLTLLGIKGHPHQPNSTLPIIFRKSPNIMIAQHYVIRSNILETLGAHGGYQSSIPSILHTPRILARHSTWIKCLILPMTSWQLKRVVPRISPWTNSLRVDTCGAVGHSNGSTSCRGCVIDLSTFVVIKFISSSPTQPFKSGRWT